MFLHLGKETVVSTRSIIGIFDIENTSVSKITKEFFSHATQEAQVINVTDELPKSFVICKDERGVRVYISQISAATLKKRAV